MRPWASEPPQLDPAVLQAAALPQDLVLPPPSPANAGLVFVPGPGHCSSTFRSMLAAVQRQAGRSGISLIAGCLHFGWADMPKHPSELRERVDEVVRSMRRQGLQPGAAVFHGAHALSTVLLQDLLSGNGRSSAGQMLLGGTMLRKYADWSLDVPTITVGAELDSETPIARQAEQFLVQKPLDPTAFPMVILEGLTHSQFGSGSLTAKQEAPPVLELEAAHERIAEVLVDFMRMRLGLPGGGSVLAERRRSTEALVQPWLLVREQLAQKASAGTSRGPAGPLRVGMGTGPPSW